MKNLLLASLFSFVFCLLFSAPVREVVRISGADLALYEHYQSLGADIAAFHPGQYLDLVIPVALEGQYRILHPNLEITQTEAQLKQNLVSDDRDIPGYRTYAGMLDELMNLQAQYPNLMTVESIGAGWGAVYAESQPYYSSFEHQIWSVKVTNNVLVEADKPALYFCGTHHAREPLSLEVSMAILIHLLENYSTNTEVTNLLNNFQIWIVPLVNPDGHKVVIDQTDVWWRKNIRDNDNNHQVSTDDNYGYGNDGVDINRNYGWEWGYISATDNISYPTHHGSAAFSEPETQAFRDFLLSKPFIAGISYHTYGQYVLYPVGYVGNVYSPDYVELRALAMSVASQVGGQQGGYYSPMNSWQLYPVSGGLDDWAYGQCGIFAYTVEMATEFIPPAAEVPQIVQNNLQGALTFLSRVNRSALKGHVTDAFTGEPLEATVWIESLDNHPTYREPYRSDDVYGSFWRFLSPGTWNVRFIKEGYLDVVENVSISNTEVTEIDVALLPVETVGLSIRVIEAGNPQLPVHGATLSINSETEQVFYTDASGSINLPDLHPGTYDVTISKDGYNTITGLMDLQDGYAFSLIQDASFSDEFEAGLANWVTTGAWGVSGGGMDGTQALSDSPTGNYQNNTESLCRLAQPFSLAGAEAVNLQFSEKHDIALDGDYATLEYSTSGTSWYSLDYFNGSADWTNQSYDLSFISGQNLYLRFTMVANNSGRSNGIFIDNLRLYVSTHGVVSNQENFVSPVKLSVYPNPAREQLHFTVNGLRGDRGELSLKIYNLRGQLVSEIPTNSLTDAPGNINWDMRDQAGRKLGSGIYFARLSQGSKVIAAKRMVITR